MDTNELTVTAIGKRSGVDFATHELLIKQSDGLVVHHLKKPDTMQGNIKFINTTGVLVVTGDYGNWMFCREFHPGEYAGVSDGYFLEKLKMYSCQEPQKYNSEETGKEIEKMIADTSDEYSTEDKEYLKEILRYTDNEYEYVYMAHFGGVKKPPYRDHEFVPFVKKINPWLEIVFDGFDEVCRRLKLGTHI